MLRAVFDGNKTSKVITSRCMAKWPWLLRVAAVSDNYR